MKLYRMALFVVLAALILSAPVCVTAEAAVKTLTIGKIQPFQLDGFNSSNWHALYYQVEVRYPKAWMDKVESSFAFTVDGKPVPFEGLGGGYGEDANRSFRFYAGTAGKKLLEVSLTVDGKLVKASQEFTATAAPVVRLMNHVKDECVFENTGLSFMVFDAKEPVVKLNGKPVAAELKPSAEFPGILIVTVPPSLQPGVNQIDISATGAAGQAVTQNFTLLFAAGNSVKLGSKLNIVWGHMGTRSGPFFRMSSDGQVLVATGSSELGDQYVIAPGSGETASQWYSAAGANVYSFTAQKAGKGTLRYEEKSHWTLPSEVKKTVEVTVVP